MDTDSNKYLKEKIAELQEAYDLSRVILDSFGRKWKEKEAELIETNKRLRESIDRNRKLNIRIDSLKARLKLIIEDL